MCMSCRARRGELNKKPAEKPKRKRAKPTSTTFRAKTAAPAKPRREKPPPGPPTAGPERKPHFLDDVLRQIFR